MGIISNASGKSVWRGYEYYQSKRVSKLVKISEDEYEAFVSGAQKKQYKVHINLSRIRQSKCNCPHADGRRIICKHMVALYFTVFPNEAEDYIREVEAYQREEELIQEERLEEIKEYVYRLSKQELREELINYILNADEYY